MNNDRFESVRQLAAKYWQIVISLIAGVLAASKVFYDVSQGLTVNTWIAIGVGLLVIVIIRFPAVAIKFTRVILGSPPVVTNPPRIFRGPLPYFKGDTLPGRKAEYDACWLLLQQQPFVILEGESGCGKSSILSAALIPQAQTRFRVIECRVSVDPIGKLCAAIRQEPYQPSEQCTSGEELAETIAGARNESVEETNNKDLLVVIDQFEELFVTVKDEVRIEFLSTLKRAIENGQMRLVVAIRNDFRDLLMTACRTVDPSQQVFNLGIYFPLQPFSEIQAISVLGEMLAPLHEGDPLKKQGFDDFSRKLVAELLIPPRDKRLCQEDKKSVLPVELQIIGMMIESVGIESISVDGLRRLGGKTGLMRAYIEDAKTYVWRKTGVPGDQSLLILRRLISPAQTKWIRNSKTIAQDLQVPSDRVEMVLNAFAEKFLVNRLPDEIQAPEDDAKHDGRRSRYELLHEHLVRILADAPQPILQKARDAEERLQFWKKRTEQTLLSPGQTTPSRFLGRLRKSFAQPIPVIESFRLWRFAQSEDFRWMLRLNLRGFVFRLTSVVVIPVIIALSGWILRTRSDSYQIATIVPNAPIEQMTASEYEVPEELMEWVLALIYVGRPEDALASVRKIKNSYQRSNVFARAATELAEVANLDKAKEVLVESLSIEKFSWEEVHSEATAVVAEEMAKAHRDAEFLKVANDLKDPVNRSQFLAATAEGLARAYSHDQSNRVFDEALATTSVIEDPRRRLEVLQSMVALSIKKKNNNIAIKSLDQALVAVQSISSHPDDKEKFEALLEIAEKYARLKHIDKAMTTFNQALSGDVYGLVSNGRERIETIAEEIAKAGKANDVLNVLHEPRKWSYNDLCQATATGLYKSGRDTEALAAIEHIRDSEAKIAALVAAGSRLLEVNRLDSARKLFEHAMTLLQQGSVSSFNLIPPHAQLAKGLLRLGEIDKAIQIARSWEEKSSGRSPIDHLSVLAEITIDLAEKNMSDKAYSASKDIRSKPERYYALGAIMVALIKSKQTERAKQVQAEGLAIMNEVSPYGATPSHMREIADRSQVNVAHAFAEAGLFDEAEKSALEVNANEERYQALEIVARELLKADKVAAALDVIDTSNETFRSRSLGNLVEWLFVGDKGEKILLLLPHIKYGDDQSRANAVLAKWQARSGLLRLARQTAESCWSAPNQLSAYTFILMEYAEKQNPHLAPKLKKILRPDNKAPTERPSPPFRDAF